MLVDAFNVADRRKDEFLATLAHEVCVAHAGTAAQEAAATFKPDFAFLDIGLPRINGYDLARRMREVSATAHSVLTAVTGWSQQSDRTRARAAGFDYHLVKPVDFQQVYRILDGGAELPAKLGARHTIRNTRYGKSVRACTGSRGSC